jgi:hypothetical protein
MSWKRSKFRIASGEGGKSKKVAGIVSESGLGLHRMPDAPDEHGRHRWMVTHLNTGLSITTVRGRDEEMAGKVADLLEQVMDWQAIKTVEDFAADPEWIARLLGIKHTMGGGWIEMIDPGMNDPKRIVWTDSKMTRQ